MLALDRIQSVETFLAASLAPQTFRTTLMLGLGIVGLMLGAIGIAGVTARTIAERMPEFGVRLALGCAGADLWRHVVLHQLRIALLGATIGLGLAISPAVCSPRCCRRRWASMLRWQRPRSPCWPRPPRQPRRFRFPRAAAESVAGPLFEGLAPLELPHTLARGGPLPAPPWAP